MSSIEWWASLLQGSLGALVGLIGLFGVFWLTRRHELSRDNTARREHAREVATQRTESGIVRIIEAAHVLRFGSEATKDADLQNLCHALTLFGVREAADHPSASKWATLESSKVLELRGSDVDIRAAPWQGAYITASLARWAELRFPEDFFPRSEGSGGKPQKPRTDKLDSIIVALDSAGRTVSYNNIREMIAAEIHRETGVQD